MVLSQVAPNNVDVILSGPLPLLDTLSPQDVRVVIDVTDLEEGTHQLTPKVEILVSDIVVESILPGTVEVVISRTPLRYACPTTIHYQYSITIKIGKISCLNLLSL